MSAISELKRAKEHSDKRQYGVKHQIIKKMMSDDPDAFYIDSDDGKGIVGVTHKKTGFRFHMPAGKVRPGLSKEAGLGDILRRQIGRIKPGELGGRAVNKVVDTLVRNPKLEEAVRGVLSYNLVDPRNRSRNTAMGALAGVLPGAGAGYAQSDDGKGGRDSVVGALSGALLGAAGGRYGPRAAQAGVGRVLTNVMDPHIYDGAMHAEDFKNLYKEHGIKGIVKSIVKDEPLQEIEPARHALMRDYFGLKRFKGTEDVIQDVSRTPDGGKRSVFNTNSSEGRRNLADVDTDREASLYWDYLKPTHGMRAGKPALTRSGAMGNFNVQTDGRWDDSWDFALHPGEKINSVTSLLRGLVSPLGTPTTLSGRTFSEGEVLRRAVPGKKFNLIDESYTTPVLNRAIRGSGVSPTETMRYIKGKLKRGEHAPFMNTLADKAEGKPYNLLHSLAKAEDSTPGDMRVMLGGTARAKDLRPTSKAELKFAKEDITRMFHNRIPGSTSGAVADAINSLPEAQVSELRRKLNAWSAAGRQPGGEIEALADTLGFAPDELQILLQ